MRLATADAEQAHRACPEHHALTDNEYDDTHIEEEDDDDIYKVLRDLGEQPTEHRLALLEEVMHKEYLAKFKALERRARDSENTLPISLVTLSQATRKQRRRDII